MRLPKIFVLFVFIIAIFSSSYSYSFDLSAFFSQAEKRDYHLKNLLHKKEAGKYRIYQAKSAYLPKVDFSSYFGKEKYRYYSGYEVKKRLRYYYLSLKQPIIHPELLAKIKESKLSNEVDKLYASQQRYYARYYALTTLIHYLVTSSRTKTLSRLVEVDKERLEKAQQLLKLKVISEDEYLDIEEDYQDASIAFQQAVDDLDTFSFMLKELVGKFSLPTSLCITSGFVNATKRILPSLVSLKSKLNNNFEVRIAQKNIEVASAEYDYRKYDKLPKLDLFASYSRSTSSGTANVERDFKVALSLEFPIFQGGYFSARQSEAEELKMAAYDEWLSTRRKVHFQFQQSFARFRQSLQRFHSFRERMLADKRLFDLYQKAYEDKSKSILDVLYRESEFLKNKDYFLQSLDDLLTSYIELHYLSSELNPDNLLLIKLLLPLYCHADKTSS